MRAAFCAFLGFAAGSAQALSCVPPDVARAYAQAAVAPVAYVVVYGRLSFDPTLLPEVDLSRQDETPPYTPIPARMTGKSLSKGGFDRDFDRDIMLGIRCYGPWCGGVGAGVPYLAFVETSADGYVLYAEPCDAFTFPEPTREMLDQAVRCIRGEGCEPAE